MLARACNVAQADNAEPTLMEEQVKQTFRLCQPTPVLLLARRFVKTVDSVTINGTALAADGYQCDLAAGILHRLSGNVVTSWGAVRWR